MEAIMVDIYSIITVAAGLSIIVLILFNFYHGKYLEYSKIYIVLTVAGCFLVPFPLLVKFEIAGSNKGFSYSAKLKDTVVQQSEKVVELNSFIAKQTTDKKVAELRFDQNKTIIELLEKLKESKDQRNIEKVLTGLNTATAIVKVPATITNVGVVTIPDQVPHKMQQR